MSGFRMNGENTKTAYGLTFRENDEALKTPKVYLLSGPWSASFELIIQLNFPFGCPLNLMTYLIQSNQLKLTEI